jgi:drug/metabolite transporter (DMT)-like permease
MRRNADAGSRAGDEPQKHSPHEHRAHEFFIRTATEEGLAYGRIFPLLGGAGYESSAVACEYDPVRSVNVRTFALLLATWLAFGSVFVVIKIGVGVMPPLVLGAIRFLFAGAILYSITIRLPQTEPDPIGPRQLIASAAIGCAMAAVNGMVMIASTKMDSWIVSVLTCTIPLWSYAASLAIMHRRLQAAELFGVCCGIGGIVVLLWPGTNEAVHVALPAAVILLATAVLWGTATVVEKSTPIPKRPLVAMGLQMLFCGIALALWSASLGEERGLTAATFLTPAAIFSIAFLVVVASVIGYGAYMWLIVNSGATIANSFGYVAPAISVLLGWLVLHESVTMRTFAGFALIVLAVTLIVAPHPFRAASPLAHRIH